MLEKTISYLKTNWDKPKHGIHKGELTFFELVCEFRQGIQSIEDSTEYPGDLLEFWEESDGATLFKDFLYGQWGLSIYSHSEIQGKNRVEKKSRPLDFIESDLIIGQFLGDSDLLLRTNNGEITVVTPLDGRNDWEVVAENLNDFLEKYVRYDGDKYWE